MSNFLEIFYFMFPYLEENYAIWYGTGDRYGGWMIGFLILILLNLSISVIYYLLGRSTSSWATVKGWFGFAGISALIVFVTTAITINYNVFDGITSLWEAPADVWIFALLNGTIYTLFVYAIFALPLRYASKHARFVPFKF